MSETFSVGEIAIVCNCIDHPENNGTEREIIGPLEPRFGFRKNGSSDVSPCYVTREVGGREWLTEPQYLRKKPQKYDGNQKTTWDDLIVWNPRKETA